MSNKIRSFVNGLNANKLKLIMSPAVQQYAKNRLTTIFESNLQKFNTHNALLSSNIFKTPLSNTQKQSVNRKRAILFATKLKNLKNRRNLTGLQTIIQNPTKYINIERRQALGSVQQIQKEFKNASKTPSTR